MSSASHIKKPFFWLLCFAVVVALISLCTTIFDPQLGTEGDVALIHMPNQATVRLPLNQDTTYSVNTEKGTNLVQVKDGVVSIIEANCPGHDCIQQGSISQVGEQIICLPHELWIEVAVESQGFGASGGGVDSVSS